MQENINFDAIIIGGSYAGLSAAMALGRSLRRALIIDSGMPCNRYTPHSHNFITQDGNTPSEIAALAKAQVLQYETIDFLHDTATSGKKIEQGFEIRTGCNHVFHARKIIVATGIKDTFPNIKEFDACWGKSVIHCPYCHGYEFRDKKTAILASAEKAIHLAGLVNNLTADLTLISSKESDFSEEHKSKLNQHNIRLLTKEVQEIIHQNGQINALLFSDGTVENFEAVYAAVPFIQHSTIPEQLGCVLNETGYLQTNSFQETSVEGIFAAGDCAGMMRSVAYAVSTGNIAGAMLNHQLVQEEF
ncbi:NAD(P)/FAD-dependent oxidoreductase [Sphingobacterium tabacisoli]|uniref:NAD(P)/FAD-dependent oxidoreductase n=1 Tax=Sphingobacterium tabacisoli TaxID=2044855 RepID=A0ABW5L7N6_9SPHI|nr:NAD(P)/FAD-dependent oxidoreductase [Sphingobacterium tabacisoli]